MVRTNGTFADDSARCDDRDGANGFTPDELALCQKALSKVPTGIEALNTGLRTLQFQSLSLNSAYPNSDVIGGTQDNGTWALTGSLTWFESIGGDGGQSANRNSVTFQKVSNPSIPDRLSAASTPTRPTPTTHGCRSRATRPTRRVRPGTSSTCA